MDPEELEILEKLGREQAEAGEEKLMDREEFRRFRDMSIEELLDVDKETRRRYWLTRNWHLAERSKMPGNGLFVGDLSMKEAAEKFREGQVFGAKVSDDTVIDGKTVRQLKEEGRWFEYRNDDPEAEFQ